MKLHLVPSSIFPTQFVVQGSWRRLGGRTDGSCQPHQPTSGTFNDPVVHRRQPAKQDIHGVSPPSHARPRSYETPSYELRLVSCHSVVWSSALCGGGGGSRSKLNGQPIRHQDFRLRATCDRERNRSRKNVDRQFRCSGQQFLGSLIPNCILLRTEIFETHGTDWTALVLAGRSIVTQA